MSSFLLLRPQPPPLFGIKGHPFLFLAASKGSSPFFLQHLEVSRPVREHRTNLLSHLGTFQANRAPIRSFTSRPSSLAD